MLRILLSTIAFIFLYTPHSRAQIIFAEDFETVTVPALPGTLTSTTTGTVGWITHTGVATFTNNWQVSAHTQYALLDDWNNPNEINNPAMLATPALDFTSVNHPYIYLQYYFVGAFYNGGGESAFLYASTNGGLNWNIVSFISGKEAWQEKYFDLAAYKGFSNVMLAVSYNDGNDTLMGMGVDNIKVFDAPANDVEVINATPVAAGPKAYGITSANINLGAAIFNHGGLPITSFAFKYQQGSNPVVTDNITGLNIAPFTSGTFSGNTPFQMPSTPGDYPITCWIELPGDADPLNDTGKTILTTVSHMPAKKILAEEGTGTWCGWCPRGAVFMDSIAKSSQYNASFSLVAVHNADTMTVPEYDAKLQNLKIGYPSVLIDRNKIYDPNKLINIYNEQKNDFGYADITLTDIPATGNNYSVKVSVKPAIALTGDYRLALVLTEDDMQGTGSAWEQSNYYSGGMNPFVGAGLDWSAEPVKVPASKMHYNHVARTIYPDTNGVAGSLPGNMTAGTNYDYTFNMPVDPLWDRNNNKLHAIVMLLDHTTGYVLNTNNIVVPLGLSDVDAGIEAFNVFPNPAANKAYVGFSLTEQSDVKVLVTDALGRTVSTIKKNDFETGNHRVDIDLSTLAGGIYNVTLQTDKGQVSARLSVVK